MARLLTAVLLLCYIYMSRVKSEVAFLDISNGSSHKEYCITYNSLWTNLSKSLGDAVGYPLVNLTSTNLCNSSGLGPDTLVGKAVVVMGGGCEFVQKAVIAQNFGAATILIASKKRLDTPSDNQTDYREVKIPLALMRYRDTEDALEMFPEGVLVKLYDPPVPPFDVSILLMLAVGVFTVAMGGYWSGVAERDALCAPPPLPPVGGGAADTGEPRAHSGDLSVSSPVKVVVFVVFMSTMLVLMFFFYKWLVYVIIVVFCVASAVALYSCLSALIEKLGCMSSSMPCLGEPESGIVRTVLLAAVCISIAVVWGVFRNEDRWIWILQDLLGMAFCINFLKTITVSNFKNGESVMVQVAFGDGSGEKLPMVMKVPRFSSWNQEACGIQFSILGFGDLIVPGLVVAYCHRFDVWTNSAKKIYFISCTIAYLSGLICTFVVMLLSRMAQPALLYLVPFTLLTSTAVACHMRQLRAFWSGTKSGYEVLDSSRDPLLQDGEQDGYQSIQRN